MALDTEAHKPPLHDQITDMQRKVQRLEEDRTAYYESSQAAVSRNREAILQLRQHNKRLHRRLADTLAGDKHVVKEAFHDRGPEKDAYREMSGKTALTVLDQEVLIKMKRLNALRHATQTCRHRLEELQLQYKRLKPEGKRKSQSTVAAAAQAEDHARNLHVLENSLEKAQVKNEEAEHVMRGYIKLKNHLQDESLTFQPQLDRLEADILKHREEHYGLQVKNSDTQLSKDAAKAELQQLEVLLYKERKERERVLACYRKQVEELRSEKADRRAQKAPMQPDELSSEAPRSTTRMAGEEERSISTFEEAFERIKEATGVTNVHEIVERFISQGESQRHLESLKVANEEVLVQLKEEKETLQQGFQDMKYSGEAKLSSGQQTLRECEQRVQEAQQRCDADKEHLDWLLKTLGSVQAGVEHLADKLQYITLERGAEAQLSPDSEDFVVQLLAQCEQKLTLLHDELQGKDLAALAKEMEEEEFYTKIEGKLPDYNIRIQLPEDQRQNPFNEDEESEEDEADIISREALKHQSQLIIDSKTKKKPRKKKKKKGRF
ncbi:Coiled-coil domain-containing protein 151 [Merluccius polli]|uniref:Coiled-coil domain-containing protein 151 n=1 Tax=Merluccius polli TaxID=89951 RepID=A0AA47LZA5_MERPO|nr:Coiled-coil domain-containing protein 151 [Merluccius polli]